jgi:hypothetical protein
MCMTLHRWSDRLLRLAGPLLVLILSASHANAQTNTWTLSGVTFNDSTAVSGFITYNFSTSTVTNWSVSVQTGASLAARVYDPSNSTAFTQNMGNPQLTIFLQESPAPASSQRQFRITPISALDGSLTTVPVNTATANNQSGGVECLNCGSHREIASGDFVIGAAVPTMSGPLLIGLTGLLMAAGSWVLLRRPAVPAPAASWSRGGRGLAVSNRGVDCDPRSATGSRG